LVLFFFLKLRQGTGQSGKSTLFKQIKLLTNEVIFQYEDSESVTNLICGAMIQSLLNVGEFMKEENLKYDTKEAKDSFEKITKFIESKSQQFLKLEGKKIYQELPIEIDAFWSDKNVQNCLEDAINSYHIFEQFRL
jgi:hypothetical protein